MTPTRPGLSPREWAALLVPAAAMLVVGCVRATNAPLDWDEGATLGVATRTVPQIVEQAKHLDGVLAPFYLFMHWWIAVFGDSVASLRAPSIITVALGVAVLARLGTRLFGPLAGLCAGLICVMIPSLSFCAQQSRPYGMSFFLIALASLALYRALDHPSWGRWLCYGMVFAAATATNLLSLLVVPAHLVALYRIWRGCKDRRLLRTAPILAAVAVIAAPLAYVGRRQHRLQLDWIGTLTGQQIRSAPADVFMSSPIAYVVIGLAALALLLQVREVAVELVVMAVLPAVLLIGLTQLGVPSWTARYVLFSIMPLALLAGAVLSRMKTAATVTLAVLAVLAWPQQMQLRDSHGSPDSRAIAGLIAAGHEPGDGIAYGKLSWSLRPTVSFYLRQTLHGRPGPRDLFVVRPAAEVGELAAIECKQPAQCLGDTKRIWFVEPIYLDPAGPGAIATTLHERFAAQQVWVVYQGRLTLLVARG